MSTLLTILMSLQFDVSSPLTEKQTSRATTCDPVIVKDCGRFVHSQSGIQTLLSPLPLSQNWRRVSALNSKTGDSCLPTKKTPTRQPRPPSPARPPREPEPDPAPPRAGRPGPPRRRRGGAALRPRPPWPCGGPWQGASGPKPRGWSHGFQRRSHGKRRWYLFSWRCFWSARVLEQKENRTVFDMVRKTLWWNRGGYVQGKHGVPNGANIDTAIVFKGNLKSGST